MRGLRGLSDPQIASFADFLARGEELAKTEGAEFSAAIDAGGQGGHRIPRLHVRDDGPAEGRMISNRNIMFQIEIAPEFLGIAEGDKTISFLPLCHIAERMGTIFNQLAIGQIVHFPENSGTVFNDIREVAPPHFCAAPLLAKDVFAGRTVYAGCDSGLHGSLCQCLCERQGDRGSDSRGPRDNDI